MNVELNGKTALVTGSGIGQATAFAREGAHVGLTDLKQDGLNPTSHLITEAHPECAPSPPPPTPERLTITRAPASRH